MEHYAGIDVSLEQSSICVVDATGKIVREAKVVSEPKACAFFRKRGKTPGKFGVSSYRSEVGCQSGGIPCPSFRLRMHAAPACPNFCLSYQNWL
jgi:hypothetical protein